MMRGWMDNSLFLFVAVADKRRPTLARARMHGHAYTYTGTTGENKPNTHNAHKNTRRRTTTPTTRMITSCRYFVAMKHTQTHECTNNTPNYLAHSNRSLQVGPRLLSWIQHPPPQHQNLIPRSQKTTKNNNNKDVDITDKYPKPETS